VVLGPGDLGHADAEQALEAVGVHLGATTRSQARPTATTRGTGRRATAELRPHCGYKTRWRSDSRPRDLDDLLAWLATRVDNAMAGTAQPPQRGPQLHKRLVRLDDVNVTAVESVPSRWRHLDLGTWNLVKCAPGRAKGTASTTKTRVQGHGDDHHRGQDLRTRRSSARARHHCIQV